MLGTLREKGITILVSTSYMDEASRCERIALINKGKVLGVDTPEGLLAGLDENLYNAVSGHMFELLTRLRELPEVEECYTFGATLHVVGKKSFNPDAVKLKLSETGLRDVEIYPAKGDIEDLFIQLTLRES